MSKPEFYVTDVSLLATLADKEAELVALRDQARRIHGGEPRWCESCNAHADLPAVAGKVRRVVGNSGDVP